MRNYPAKLLLFGEYSVILGSEALAIPLRRFSGHWAATENKTEVEILQQRLYMFAMYLNEVSAQPGALFRIDVNRFQQDLKDGIYFQSNVPLGYGLGSSGAVCAAVYDKYGIDKEKDTASLKKIFAVIESFFHGSSSGTDPLVCYLEEAIHIVNGIPSGINLPETENSNKGFLLLDTKIPRHADPLITLFMQKSKSTKFKNLCTKDLNPAVAAAIRAVKNKDHNLLKESVRKINDFQALHFKEMIPEPFRAFWKPNPAAAFIPKICGAGGGGYILLYSWDVSRTLNHLSTYEITKAFTIADQDLRSAVAKNRVS